MITNDQHGIIVISTRKSTGATLKKGCEYHCMKRLTALENLLKNMNIHERYQNACSVFKMILVQF